MSSKSASDPWEPQTASPKGVSRSRRAVETKDSWDDSDDDEEEEEGNLGERNQKIWEAANNSTKAPMPTILSHPTVAPIPHQGAFEPTMRILKRPKNEDGKAAGTAGASRPNSAQELKERQERYQAARDRIFSPNNEGLTEGDKDKHRGAKDERKESNSVKA